MDADILSCVHCAGQENGRAWTNTFKVANDRLMMEEREKRAGKKRSYMEMQLEKEKKKLGKRKMGMGRRGGCAKSAFQEITDIECCF